MSIQPPKIDQRSYEDIVTQTACLVEDYSVELVEPTVESLINRTLNEDIKNGEETIFRGTLINQEQARKISQIHKYHVQVKGWQAPGAREVDPKSENIINFILNEDIAYLVTPEIDKLENRTLNEDIYENNQKIAIKGTGIDASLAQKISKLKKSTTTPERVKLLARRGTIIDAALAEVIREVEGLTRVKIREKDSKSIDAGWALIRIFGRMAKQVSDRLNQVPDKNFLAFLDLIGTELLPPQPAKVPLSFSLTEGSPVDVGALVPAHTQVAAPPAEGQEDEVVFETDRELVVTTAQLKAVFVREPEKDCYSDRTSQATGKKDTAFKAFVAEQPIEHCLYLACDDIFALPGNKTVTLKFDFTEATELAKLPISWSYWDGSWRSLSPSLSNEANTNNWKVTITDLTVPTQLNVNSIEARWLRVSLEQTFLDEDAKAKATQLKVKDVKGFIVDNNTIRIAAGSNNQEDRKITKVEEKTLTIEQPLKHSHSKKSSGRLSRVPTINSITVSAEIKQNDLTPDFCFFNTVPIDLSKDFYSFGEQPRFNDTLYIASKEAFARHNTKVTLTVTLSEGLFVNTDERVEIAWEVWDGQNWQKLETNSTTLNGENITGQKSSPANFTNNGKVEFTLSKPNPQTTVNGETNYWIRARIVKGNFGIQLSQTTTIAVLREDVQKNTKELKVNSVRGFMPNDTIKIVAVGKNPEIKPIEIDSIHQDNTLKLKNNLQELYSKGTNIILDSHFGPPSVKSLRLTYRYEASSSLSACCAYNDFHYVYLLTTVLREKANSGQKILKLASVAGFAKGDRLWIDRNEEIKIEAVDLEQKTVTIEPALTANRADGVTVEFFTILQDEAKSGETILTLSNVKRFAVGDRLQIVTSDIQEYEIAGVNLDRQTVTLRSALIQKYPKNTKVLQSFQPFKATADRYPAFYLGFNKQFANRPTTLFTQVEPPHPGQIKAQPRDTEPVQLVWEYASPSGWFRLGVQDETKAFVESGLIQFIGPTDFIKTLEFGQEFFWLRVSWQQGEFRVPPRLRRLLTNTMWATQATTLKDEILGSSDGNPNQIFRTVQKPVLKGQRLEVQEAKTPSAEELAIIRSQEGEEAVREVKDETGQIEAVWVRWHKVRDFYESESRDRHYVLDRLTGEVQFGDGQYGMVPPQGRNNIRLSQYQTGGGTRGNLAANTIVQLKTTIPYVDSVTNLEAAGGGSEQESLEQVKERGPKWLRHRDRAVTIQDFEDLAYEASPDVARAKASRLKFNPIQMEWIPIFHLSLSSPGDITVTSLTELQESQPIYVEIYDPGKAIYYAEGELNNKNKSITYKVTPEKYNLGKEWTVILTNEQKEMVTQAVKIVYPTGSITENLQIPPKNDSNKHNPYQNNAEVVELILVPHSKANQPTPSIALLNQVKQYICDRSSPALRLQVTEPNWVEVAITATVVPVSWESADQVKIAAVNRLHEFLHPLTGSKKRQGWEFSRYPHKSDLYAVLEEIEGVDYVKSLSIEPEKLPSVCQEQCLIYSGIHQVSLGERST